MAAGPCTLSSPASPGHAPAAELRAAVRAIPRASSTRATGKSVWNLSPVAGAFVCNEKHFPPSPLLVLSPFPPLIVIIIIKKLNAICLAVS